MPWSPRWKLSDSLESCSVWSPPPPPPPPPLTCTVQIVLELHRVCHYAVVRIFLSYDRPRLAQIEEQQPLFQPGILSEMIILKVCKFKFKSPVESKHGTRPVMSPAKPMLSSSPWSREAVGPLPRLCSQSSTECHFDQARPGQAPPCSNINWGNLARIFSVCWSSTRRTRRETMYQNTRRLRRPAGKIRRRKVDTRHTIYCTAFIRIVRRDLRRIST